MASNDSDKFVTADELFDVLHNFENIEALHELAGEEGKLIVREDGTIEVVTAAVDRESSNG